VTLRLRGLVPEVGRFCMQCLVSMSCLKSLPDRKFLECVFLCALLGRWCLRYELRPVGVGISGAGGGTALMKSLVFDKEWMGLMLTGGASVMWYF
jgi:hypothetical protein